MRCSLSQRLRGEGKPPRRSLAVGAHGDPHLAREDALIAVVRQRTGRPHRVLHRSPAGLVERAVAMRFHMQHVPTGQLPYQYRARTVDACCRRHPVRTDGLPHRLRIGVMQVGVLGDGLGGGGVGEQQHQGGGTRPAGDRRHGGRFLLAGRRRHGARPITCSAGTRHPRRTARG